MTVDGGRGRWPSLKMSSRRSRALPQREGPAPRVALAVILPDLPRTSSSRAGAASRLCLWPHWGHGSRTRASSFLRFAFFSGEGAASCDRQAGSRSRSRGGASSTCSSPSGCRWTWLCGVLCRQARPPVDIDYCDPIVSTPFTATQEGRVVTLSAWMGDEPLVRLPCSRGAPPAGRRRHRVPPPFCGLRSGGGERSARHAASLTAGFSSSGGPRPGRLSGQAAERPGEDAVLPGLRARGQRHLLHLRARPHHSARRRQPCAEVGFQRGPPRHTWPGCAAGGPDGHCLSPRLYTGFGERVCSGCRGNGVCFFVCLFSAHLLQILSGWVGSAVCR